MYDKKKKTGKPMKAKTNVAVSHEKQQWQPSVLLGPVPAVLVTCGDGEVNNVLTIAWTGTLNSKPPKTYISVRPERYSHELISKTGEFVINLMPSGFVRKVDTCGVKSGRDIDKFEECGLKKAPSFAVSCPTLADAAVSIECRVCDTVELGSHTMFIADVVSCDVDPTLLDVAGKLHLERAGLMAYLHGEYYTLGKKIGSYGYSVKKPRPKNEKKEK